LRIISAKIGSNQLEIKFTFFGPKAKNPHFHAEIHQKIARKSPDFAIFQKPFVKSNPPFVK